MDDRRALMAAILANPDDDTPRLVFADWLQENGDKHDQARAEFIRLQIESAKLPFGDAKRTQLDASATKLADAHKVAWVKPLAPFAVKVFGVEPAEIAWSRGLLRYLMVRTAEFMNKECQKQLPDALAAVGVEAFHFYSTTARFKVLAAAPAIRWTTSVSYHEADDAALAAFGASPEWAHLSRMTFDVAKVTDAGLEAFAQDAGQTRLRQFGCSTSGGMNKVRGKYTAAGLIAILDSGRFPLLDALDLEGDAPPKFDFAALLWAPAMKRIRTLRLGSGVEMAAVAVSPSLTGLRELAVNSGRITDPDAKTLLNSPVLANLTKLEMYGMNWGHPRLSKSVEDKLRARFGERVLTYSPEQK
jgi:uncharacterized protein (TIGR02996 family)